MSKQLELKRNIYELRITLLHTKPPIWRRVAVPADLSLAELHEIVQIAIGWCDEHLHQFRMKTGKRPPGTADLMGLYNAGRLAELTMHARGERTFTDHRVEDMEGEDESRAVLGELCRRVGDKLIYEYDFGDGWEHAIEVRKIFAPKGAERYPRCLAGKLAGPLEDSGGVWGYYDKLAAIADTKHPEHEEVGEWMGDEFDPERFDVDEVNAVFDEWRRHAQPRRRSKAHRSNRDFF